jgi:hypothetical protein
MTIKTNINEYSADVKWTSITFSISQNLKINSPLVPLMKRRKFTKKYKGIRQFQRLNIC